jgi:hypothetical protein
VWRPRALLWTGAGLLLVLSVAGLTSASSVHSAPPSPGSCGAHYAPVAACTVPSGGTLDPCNTVSFGVTHCPFTLPDLNPADWLQWFGCTILADASLIGQIVGAAIVNILTTIGNQIANAFATVESAILTPIVGATMAISNGITSFVSWVNGFALSTGPFAPVVTIGILGALLVAGAIGFYFASVLLFAAAKTLFNLL